MAYLATSGSSVVIATYVTVAITISILAVRLTLSILWKRKLGWDDNFLFLSGFLAITESIMSQKVAENSSIPYIRSGNFILLDKIFQLNYASDLIFLFVMSFSRASVICLLNRMVPPKSLARRMSPILHGINLVWTIFSVFAVAFQCGSHMPWIYLPTRCVGSGALWYPILIGSVCVDVFLSTPIFPELPNLPFKPNQKTIIAILFAGRSVVCISAIIHLAFLVPALHSESQPRAILVPNILRQVVMNFSVIAAAIPALYKPASTVQYETEGNKDLASPLDSPTSSTRRRRFFSFYTQRKASLVDSEKQPQKQEKNRVISFVPMSNLPVLKLPFGDDSNRTSRYGLGHFLKSDHKRAGSSQDFIISESIASYVNNDLESGQKKTSIQIPKPALSHKQ